MATSFLNNKKYPRGLANNNPGNLIYVRGIKWIGKVPAEARTDKRFEQFVELRYGIRALYRNILSNVKKGNNTLVKLITAYAPAFENNTAAYIDFMAKSIGVSPRSVLPLLDQSMLLKISKAIITVENGKAFEAMIQLQDYMDGFDVMNDTVIRQTIWT